jgi:hypothetical protein
MPKVQASLGNPVLFNRQDILRNKKNKNLNKYSVITEMVLTEANGCK